MLLGALSGFRDFRTPLVVGYVVGLAMWLFLFDLLPEGSAAAHRDYPEISRIADIVGPVGVAAALSFLAYLVGGVVVRLTAQALQIRGQPIEAAGSPSRQSFRQKFSFTHDAEMDDLEDRLKDLVQREIAAIKTGSQREDVLREIREQPLGQSRQWFKVRQPATEPRQVLEPDERVRVEAKSGRIDERILAQNSELYSELYRLRSEAELRAGLLPSLVLLALAAAIHVSWPVWLLLLLSPPFALFLLLLLDETFELRTRARGIALRAVIDGLVTTPTLDLIRRRAEEAQAG
jgi:hypothetical protein